MIIFLHVVIALSSIVATSLAYLQPSSMKLRVSYALIVLTVLSGSYLVVVMPAHMLQTCMTGLAYVGIVTVGIVAARRRMILAEDTANINR